MKNDYNLQRGKKRKAGIPRKSKPVIKTTRVSYPSLPSTTYTPIMKAKDIIVKAIPSKGNENFREVSSKERSPKSGQRRITATMMELYMATFRQKKTKSWDLAFLSNVICVALLQNCYSPLALVYQRENDMRRWTNRHAPRVKQTPFGIASLCIL